MNVHIDFETYSQAPIKSVGTWVYAEHPTTEVLCMSYAIDDGKPQLWLPDDPLPEFVTNPENITLHAWNSFFEYAIWHQCLKWPDVPVKQWDNTQAHAMALSLPRSLGECARVLGLDEQKDKRGTYLIQRLCKPYRGKRITDKDLLLEFYEYCKQDVVTERAIADKLFKINNNERVIWELDQTINIRGIPVDKSSVNHAISIYQQESQRLFDELVGITGLANPRSQQQFLSWLQNMGIEADNVQAESLRKLLNEPISSSVKEAIELKIQIAKTPIKKYEAINNMAAKDDRLHGMFVYHGASTGRLSSTGINFQNLPRPSIESTDECIEDFKYQDNLIISDKYGPCMSALGSCIRGMVKATTGKRLIIADFASIEARVLAWVADQRDVLEVFNTHGKIYEHTAAKIYRCKVEDVDKDMRFISKVAVLALGYQGGKVAFQNMSNIYGVDIEEHRAERVKNEWRDANSNIVQLWYDCNQAALDAVEYRGETFKVNSKIAFRVIGQFLFCKLPSGRLIAYFRPNIQENRYGSPCVGFWGRNSMTGKWEKQTTYAGKLVENLTQAIARDLLVEAMLRIEASGYPIIMSVHDEIVSEAPQDFGSVEHFKTLMCELPTWAEGLPIDAEVMQCQRYRK